jgi:hypothetical protein
LDVTAYPPVTPQYLHDDAMYVKKLVDDVNNKIEIYYFFTEIETTKNVLHVTKFNFTVKNELRVYKVDDDIIILVFNINQIKS